MSEVRKITNDVGQYDTTTWERIASAKHPRDSMRGILVRNRRTGIYVVFTAGVCRSVSQIWANRMAAETAS